MTFAYARVNVQSARGNSQNEIKIYTVTRTNVNLKTRGICTGDSENF